MVLPQTDGLAVQIHMEPKVKPRQILEQRQLSVRLDLSLCRCEKDAPREPNVSLLGGYALPITFLPLLFALAPALPFALPQMLLEYIVLPVCNVLSVDDVPKLKLGKRPGA